MNKLTGLVGAMLAGAGAMYLFDPDRGARRRALVRDQATSARRRTVQTLQRSLEDVRNRAAGTFEDARERWRGETVPDDVLTARVCARLGLVCDIATLDVNAHDDGCVTIRGVVSRAEIPMIIRTAKWTRGVRMVDDQLQTDEEPAAEIGPAR